MVTRKRTLKFDEIGYWSEIKLDIIKDYAAAYSTILSKQQHPKLTHVYIDGFAGAGQHIAKDTGEVVAGSPLNALRISPPFRHHFLIDLDGSKVEHLRSLVGDRSDVEILHGDCNKILLNEVFPKVRFKDYQRGLCILDPYGMNLDWRVIEAAGKSKAIDMFLNFPVMDMNRNALWRNPDAVPKEGLSRMSAFWGDDSWRQVAYRKQKGLFGDDDIKRDNDTVAAAFGKRLKEVGGFAHVAEPLPMRNKRHAVVYYLFFASQKAVADKIIKAIFKKHRDRTL